MEISFYPDAPVILVDASYYIFHRYFATLRWYMFKQPNLNDFILCDNPEFMEAYFKHLRQDLEKYRKKLGTKKSTLVFLRDCPQNKIWRNEFYVSYKSGREVSSKLDTRIFQRTYEWLHDTHHSMLRQDGLEADDLAYLAKCEIRKVSSEQPLVYISNDNDYIQLCDTHCKCFNASLKNIQERCKYGGNADVEMRAKILLGDRSDAIQPCWMGTLKKAFPKFQTLLEMEESVLIETLRSVSEDVVQQYYLNQRLVDWRHIPVEFQTLFAQNVTFNLKNDLNRDIKNNV